MGDIVFSTRARQNLLALRNTAKLTPVTQSRLATGKQANSVLDSPVNFFTASGLEARAGALNALIEAMANGVKTLEAAGNGLTSIIATLQAMQSTLREARLDQSCKSQVYRLGSVKLASMPQHLQFSGGSVGATPVEIALEHRAGGSQQVLVDGTSATLELTAATTGATGATSQLATRSLTARNLANTSGLTNETIAGANATVTDGTNTLSTVDQIVSDINNNPLLKNKVTASNDSGKLRIKNLSAKDLTVTGIDGNANVDGSGGTSTVGGNEVRADLATQFNRLRNQLAETVRDSSFRGVNLLAGDTLKMFFNETGTSTLTIQATDPAGNPFAFNARNLGIPALAPSDLDVDTAIDGYLDTITQALNTTRSEASYFGASLLIVQNRRDFTNAMIRTLNTGADGLMPADPNEEGANLLALQTRQQLSATALSLAAQADQALLRLFG